MGQQPRKLKKIQMKQLLL